MVKVIVKDAALQEAAEQGMDEFLQAITDAIYKAIGGELTAETMAELNSDQITLLAYIILRDAVMDGGFVELKMISETHRLYGKYHEQIEQDCTQEEFDALYEQFPEFDDYDDAFVEHEEEFTSDVAHYVDDHLDDFCKIEK